MDPTPGSALVSDFRRAVLAFDHGFKHPSKIYALSETLNFTAQALAESESQAGQDENLWRDLNKLWHELERTLLSSFWDNDDSDDDLYANDGDDNHNNDHNHHSQQSESSKRERALRTLCAGLAKFLRNLVAGVPANQSRAFQNEPQLRRLLHYYTSWSAMEDNESVSTARILTQALSNTVTTNDPLVAKLWETYMNLPEDQVVIIRLLASPDSKTLLTTLIFILNCIHGSPTRTRLLTKTPVGVRVCIGLLDNMVRLHEAEEGSEGAKAFDIGYSIFTEFVEGGFVPSLYKRFAVKDEPITPHQTTLLKLVDSWLQSTQLESNHGIHAGDILKIHETLGSFLAKQFWSLGMYATYAIHRALGTEPAYTYNSNGVAKGGQGRTSSDSSDSSESTLFLPPTPPSRATGSSSSSSGSSSGGPGVPGELDVLLPKACEALVLVTQCIVTIALEAEEQELRIQEGVAEYVEFTNMKEYFCKKRFGGEGVVETLIELLRQLDFFLPRINFGKPVSPTGGPLPAHVPSPAEGAGFSYLKRDLVRLLGVLCHGSKDVQERIRAVGGIPVVMNMCVVDERNPYLREHAIFTLSNILKDNIENQKVVASMRPTHEPDANGQLRRTS